MIRSCPDCGKDISDHHGNSKRCKPCAKRVEYRSERPKIVHPPDAPLWKTDPDESIFSCGLRLLEADLSLRGADIDRALGCAKGGFYKACYHAGTSIPELKREIFQSMRDEIMRLRLEASQRAETIAVSTQDDASCACAPKRHSAPT